MGSIIVKAIIILLEQYTTLETYDLISQNNTMPSTKKYCFNNKYALVYIATKKL